MRHALLNNRTTSPVHLLVLVVVFSIVAQVSMIGAVGAQFVVPQWNEPQPDVVAASLDAWDDLSSDVYGSSYTPEMVCNVAFAEAGGSTVEPWDADPPYGDGSSATESPNSTFESHYACYYRIPGVDQVPFLFQDAFSTDSTEPQFRTTRQLCFTKNPDDGFAQFAPAVDEGSWVQSFPSWHATAQYGLTLPQGREHVQFDDGTSSGFSVGRIAFACSNEGQSTNINYSYNQCGGAAVLSFGQPWPDCNSYTFERSGIYNAGQPNVNLDLVHSFWAECKVSNGNTASESYLGDALGQCGPELSWKVNDVVFDCSGLYSSCGQSYPALIGIPGFAQAGDSFSPDDGCEFESVVLTNDLTTDVEAEYSAVSDGVIGAGPLEDVFFVAGTSYTLEVSISSVASADVFVAYDGSYNGAAPTWPSPFPSGSVESRSWVVGEDGPWSIQLRCETNLNTDLIFLTGADHFDGSFSDISQPDFLAGVDACFDALAPASDGSWLDNFVGTVTNVLNPVNYITSSACVVEWAVVPSRDLDFYVAQLGARFQQSSLGSAFETLRAPFTAVQAFTNGATSESGTCDGPAVEWVMSGESMSMNPLSTCDSTVAQAAGVIRTLLTFGVYASGAFLCARIVLAAFGYSLSVGNNSED